jgi:FG-GAP-like repeat/Abnormal spindle-like microcephaly-assoc'd, ASPM-SPD-2-Hydin
VRILKDFKFNHFVSADSEGVIALIFGSADCKGVSWWRGEMRWPRGAGRRAFWGEGSHLERKVFTTEVAESSSTLYFLAGNGDGTFQPPIPAQTVGGDDFISAAADFNGDGKLDLFLSDNGMLTDDILLGNGNGRFQSPVSYPFATAFSICRAGVVDDLNADGKLDLAFCSGDASDAGVIGFQLGNGDGTFQAATNVVALTQAVPYPSSIVAGDFRGNGRVDLVVPMAAGASTPFSIYLQGNFPVASANPGRLTFSSQDPNTSSPAQVVTLTNTGTLPVTFSGASIGGTNAASFGQTNTCGASLAAGASCDINVTFAPTTSGQPMATLNISDSAIGSPQVVYLTGATNGPGLTFSPPSITFNSQYVGTSGLPQSLTLTNTALQRFRSRMWRRVPAILVF